MSSPMPGALGPDNSVRPAREADLEAIGAVHHRSWTGPYAQVLPTDLVAALTPEPLSQAWRAAVTSPPSSRHHLHVAIGDGLITGFVASAPEEDLPTVTQIVALEVDPLHSRCGHGSRLLAAVVDTCRGEGVEQLQTWVHVDDAIRATFLRGAGFDTDGARRRRALTGATADADAHRAVWPEVRLVAWLDTDNAAGS